ncbi:MAG: CdaR family protein [Bacillota bacterium]
MEKFLKSNHFARVLAVFLALILWLFVTGEHITQTTPARKTWQDVPLRVENISQDYVVTEIPSSVDFTLEGLPENLEDLTMQEIDAFVDLVDKEPGKHLVRVQGRSPNGITIVSIDPEQVRVTIEEYLTDEFPVEIDLMGEPADGWELIDYTVEPAEVYVGAPESSFQEIEKVTALVDLTGMRLVDRVDVEPTARDSDTLRVNGDVLIDPEEITVKFELERIEEDNDS